MSNSPVPFTIEVRTERWGREMEEKERWRSLDETMLEMRGRTHAMEMLVTELMLVWLGPNPKGVEIATAMRARMLSDVAGAELDLSKEERAVRQLEATHSALTNMFEHLLVVLKHGSEPAGPELG